ncbi:Uncharacterized protein Rs2_42656 [Raphanus sativus]|nr:Uncharacterized protein Rs2_42656 [Raphanus sativus]
MGQVSESALCFWSWLVRSAVSVGGLTALRELRCWSSSDGPGYSGCASPRACGLGAADSGLVTACSADFGSGGGGSSFTWCWGFALLLEEVVRLGSGDAAPSLHRLRGRARLSKLSAIKLLWFSVVLSFVRSWLRPCPSSDLEGSP